MSDSNQTSFRVYVDILSDEDQKETREHTKNNPLDTDKNREELIDSVHGLSSRGEKEIDKNRQSPQGNEMTETGNSNLLCGYLYKRRLGTKLNQYKRRWFKCCDNTCQLLYYKTDSDVSPLGQIDISSAALTIDLENERQNVFKISSRNSVYLLQAPDVNTLSYWILELQKRRRTYNSMKDAFAGKSLMSKSIQQPQKGLVKSDQERIEDPGVTSMQLTGETEIQTLFEAVLKGSNKDQTPEQQLSAGSGLDKERLQMQYGKAEFSIAPTSHKDMEQDKTLTRSSPVKHSNQALATLHHMFFKASTSSRIDSCAECKQLETRLALNEEYISSLKEDLQAKDKVIDTLRNHIHLFVDDQNMGLSQTESRSCANIVSMYQEIIQSKDVLIESLTKRLDALAADPLTDKHSSAESLTQLQKLQDACEAYRRQNMILNQEILELSMLREQDELREHALRVNYAKLEADYYCVKSKYLVCLRDLERPRLEGAESGVISQEMVTSLLQEAMDSEAKPQIDRPNIQENQRYDKYGFWFMPPEANTDVQSRADSLLRRSDELAAKTNSLEDEISSYVRWENFIQKQGNRSLERSQELKQLIRGGIPVEYREKIWNFCVQCHIGRERQMLGAGYYENLLKKSGLSASLNPAVTQIELDLLRTLPNNRYYECLSSDGIPKLRNVLLAYSFHKPDIGYCQGLNRLAAIALLFLEEEDAFWCLVAITDYIMPSGYYSRGLLAAHVDMRVLKDLIADKVPKVHVILEQQQVDLVLFAFNWFMTLFVDNTPVETYLRIWDTFLFEGSKILFRFAVAFFLYREDEIIKSSKDRMELHHCLRSIGQHITDVHKVAQIAFNSINPFPMKYITTKRNFHSSVVQAELGSIQELRASLQETKVEHGCFSEGAAIRKDEEPFIHLNSDDDTASLK